MLVSRVRPPTRSGVVRAGAVLQRARPNHRTVVPHHAGPDLAGLALGVRELYVGNQGGAFGGGVVHVMLLKKIG